MAYPLGHRGASILLHPRPEQLSRAATILPFQLGKQGFRNIKISGSSEVWRACCCSLQTWLALPKGLNFYTAPFLSRSGGRREVLWGCVFNHVGELPLWHSNFFLHKLAPWVVLLSAGFEPATLGVRVKWHNHWATEEPVYWHTLGSSNSVELLQEEWEHGTE